MARIPAGDSAPDETPDAALSDDVLRQVAQDNLSLDYDTLGPDDQAFIQALASGQLSSLTGTVDPDNPLIPGEEDATPTDGVDGGGVGPVADAPTDEGADDGAPPSSALDSVLPPAVPFIPDAAATEPDDATDPVIDLGDGISMRQSELRARLAQQNAPQFTDEELRIIQLQRAGLATTALIDPQTGLPITPQPMVPPGYPTQPGQPPYNPYAQPPQQQQDEWIDPQAQQAYMGIQQQLDQIAGNQRQQAQAIINQQNLAIGSGLEAGIALFQQQRGTNDVETDRVMRQVNALGSLPQFAQMYPGDASRAIAAAMDSAYWNNPDFREREMQKLIAARDQSVAPVEAKKALAGGIVSSPGTVSRTPPAATTREQRDAGMVSAIEDALRSGQ